jgi:hypothetical protein
MNNEIRLMVTIEFDGELLTPTQVMENVKNALVYQTNTYEGLAPLQDEIVTNHIRVEDPMGEMKAVIFSF